MRNERLRTALLERGMSIADLAEFLTVDPKTVERWIAGRTPYRKHRYAVAAHLGVDEAYLWPDALDHGRLANASESEIINIYPHRWTVGSDLWRNFFERAETEIGVLVFRLLLGDQRSEAVAQRGKDEGIGDAIAARITNALVLFGPLRGVENIQFRQHGTTLYNSIYRADDQVLVNTHIFGFPASQAPVLQHLRRVAGGSMVTTYLGSFDRVWDLATPLDGS
jgi:transcriptional regulator with XRE-family HTH domain